MPAVARVGDPSSHGGMITSGSSTRTVDGIACARVGDLHTCPIKDHGVTPIGSGSPSTSVDGRPVARVGSVVGCGAVISAGSPTYSTD
jgi:uncharacterized Zn-binding protein involved in type VI secretion